MPDPDTAPPDATPAGAASAQAAKPLPVAVIDVDGVVADVRHRLTHLDGGRKDWDAFFAAAADDPPIPEGVARVQQLAVTHDIMWLTGRPESLRQTTLQWFAAQGLPAGRLIMRRGADRRPARIVKRAELRRLASRRTVAMVLDDDPAVVDALRADGWPVEQATWIGYTETLGQAQEGSGKT